MHSIFPVLEQMSFAFQHLQRPDCQFVLEPHDFCNILNLLLLNLRPSEIL